MARINAYINVLFALKLTLLVEVLFYDPVGCH